VSKQLSVPEPNARPRQHNELQSTLHETKVELCNNSGMFADIWILTFVCVRGIPLLWILSARIYPVVNLSLSHFGAEKSTQACM
jgi:hypothetical protein